MKKSRMEQLPGITVLNGCKEIAAYLKVHEQTAIRAGYSPKTAKQKGCRLLTNAKVC